MERNQVLNTKIFFNLKDSQITVVKIKQTLNTSIAEKDLSYSNKIENQTLAAQIKPYMKLSSSAQAKSKLFKKLPAAYSQALSQKL